MPRIIWNHGIAIGNAIAAGTDAGSTLTGVNGSTGFNQIINAILMLSSETSTTISGVSNVAPGDPFDHVRVNSCQTAINAIRAQIGMSSWPFSSVIAGGRIFASTYLDMVTALFLQFVISTSAHDLGNNTANSPGAYPTLGSTFANNVGTGVGKTIQGGVMCRTRAGQTFTLPTIHGSAVTASLDYGLTAVSEAGEPLTVAAYASGSDDSSYPMPTFTSGWSTPSGKTLIGTDADANMGTIDVANSVLAGRSGANLSILLGTSAELAGTGGEVVSFFGVNGTFGALTVTYS